MSHWTVRDYRDALAAVPDDELDLPLVLEEDSQHGTLRVVRHAASPEAVDATWYAGWWELTS